MSIFLKLSRTGSESRLMRLRGAWGQIGEDSSGILCSGNVSKPYFSIYLAGSRYFVKFEEPGMSFNNAIAARGEQHPISTGDTIYGPDFSIVAVPATPQAELLAHSNADTIEIPDLPVSVKSLPVVSFSCAGISHRCSLYPDIDFTLGSSQSDSIFLELDGVQPSHIVLTYRRQSGVHIRPAGGSALLNGRKMERECMIEGAGTVVLTPIGLQISVERSSAQ